MANPIELLAPARDADTAIQAIMHGADAVYIGADGFGARAAAGNSLTDIARVVEEAHKFHVRVYVTVNTIIYDNELDRVERLVHDLYNIGVDALIVQDMGLLRLDLPPIALHASTQCDTRTAGRARFLHEVGFSQIVLPREFTLDEIAAVHRVTDARLEAFVHGALCVSYSGDCHASLITKGRSANRGECAQICRLPYDLFDGNGNCLMRQRHLLSLRDLNRSHSLEAMLDAGVTSFKIEGRLKDTAYVKNVVARYSRELDKIVECRPNDFVRQSKGRTDTLFTPDLAKSFNRGFTTYFLDGQCRNARMASIYTPKAQGECVGKVERVSRDGMRITARLTTELANGDGLSYFDSDGRFAGFRVNRVDGNTIFPATPVDIAPGTELRRTADKRFDDLLASRSSSRTLPVNATLDASDTEVTLRLTDTRGNDITASMPLDRPLDTANTPQLDKRRDTLAKLGTTVYILDTLDDRAGNRFIPGSQLATLRRTATTMLDQANTDNYVREKRRNENVCAIHPDAPHLTYHANVANRLAQKFYHDHGVVEIEPALEVTKPDNNAEKTVMTTRYCVRRELGACLRSAGGKNLKEPLTLRSGAIELGLTFDCGECRMKVTAR